MPRNNLGGLYSGGAVVFNSNPQQNFLIQGLAKKQAQRDALDQYYRGVQDKLSEKEMRPQDAELWQNKLDDWRQFYLENKKSILNGDIKANSEFNQRYRDLLTDVQKSKFAAQQELLAAQHHFSGKWSPSGDDFQTMEKMGRSIYDPNHYKDPNSVTPYSVNDLSVYVPDLDEKKYLSGVTFGQKTSEIPMGKPQDIGNLRLRQQYGIGYTDDQLKSFGNKIMLDASENRSVKKSADKQFEQLDMFPEVKNQLNSVFKNYYGRDAQTPAEYYAAEKLSTLSQKETKFKDYTNEEAKIGLQNRNSINRLYLYAGIQGKDPATIERNIDGLIANHIDEARSNNGNILVDNETFKSLTGQNKERNSFLKVDEQGNYTYGKKVTGDDGTVTERVMGNIPLDAAKIKLTKTYKSGLDSRYNTGEGTYNIKGKTYSEKDLLKMGYNLDQIAPYKIKK